jgi:hypothetical protein
MHGVKGVGQPGEARGLAERVGEWIVGARDQRVEVAVDERPDHPVTEAFCSGVDREDFSGRQRIGFAVGLGENDVFPRRELAAVVEPDGAGDQQRLPHCDGAVEEGLAGPDALEHAAVVAEDGVEDAKPAPGRQHPLGDYPAYACDLLTDLRPGERRDGGGVHIAMGEVPEEIPRGEDAEPLELLGAALAYPLEELDRHVESHGARLAISGGAGAGHGWLVGPSLRS